MKNKSVFPTPFFTAFFSKMLPILFLFVFFAFNASAQALQPLGEDTTWVPTYVLDNVSGSTVSAAKIYSNGIVNKTHQSPEGILIGRTENIQQKNYWMKQGVQISNTVAFITTHDILKFDAAGNLTSGGTSPSYFAHRYKQLIIQTLKSGDTTIYLMQDEYIATSHKRVWISIANATPTEVFPGMSSTAQITSVRFHGGGKIAVFGSFSASDFAQIGTWSNIFLYNLNVSGPSAYTAWNAGTHVNYSCYAYPADGIVNSSIFPIIQVLPSGGGQLVFGKVGVNGYYSVTPVDLWGQDIKSVTIFSETDIYVYLTISVFNDTKLMHWNGVSWSTVPNSPVQSFTGGYNDFLDYNPTTGNLTSNFVTINVAAGPSSATVNTPSQQAEIDNYQAGMWEVNGHFFKWSNVGGPKLMTKQDLTPPPTTVITIPSEGQIFPAGTTFVTISGNANAFAGDTVKVYSGNTVIKTDVADVNGTWGMIITGLTPGTYSYKVTRTDPHGNENMGTVVNFTISANSTVGVTDIDEASTVLVAQSGNNITLTSEKQMNGYVISNTAGQILSVVKQQTQQFELSLENYSTGVYYITIYGDRTKYTKSVLKR